MQVGSVHRTWFEWSFEDGAATPTLVVEVSFDTDPNSRSFARASLDAIWAALQQANPDEAMPISRVRITPRKYEV